MAIVPFSPTCAGSTRERRLLRVAVFAELRRRGGVVPVAVDDHGVTPFVTKKPSVRPHAIAAGSAPYDARASHEKPCCAPS